MPLSLPLRGDGFILREFLPPDAQALAAIEFDPDVKRYLAVPDKPRSEWIENIQRVGIRGWVVQRDDGQVAGSASLDRARRKGDGELRIVIGKDFWGQALGSKVAKLLIQVAFEQLSAKAIIGVVHPDNKASLRLVRLFRFRRRGVKQDPDPQWQLGHYIYRLTKRAYNQQIERDASPAALRLLARSPHLRR